MSTRNSNSVPWPVALALFVGVAVVVGYMANLLLGELQATGTAPNRLSWWTPLLAYGLPGLVIGGALVWLYLQR